MILSPGPIMFCLHAKGEHEDNSGATILEKTFSLPVLDGGFNSRSREHQKELSSWKSSSRLVMCSIPHWSVQGLVYLMPSPMIRVMEQHPSYHIHMWNSTGTTSQHADGHGCSLEGYWQAKEMG